MTKDGTVPTTTTIWNIRGNKSPITTILSLLVMVSMILPGFLLYLPVLPVSGQTNPPANIGDWIISDTTIVKDQTLFIVGNVLVKSGGNLTLDNTILQLHINDGYPAYYYSFTVDPGGALYITNGSYVGTPDKYYILTAAPGSKLRITDSTINGLGAIPIGSTDAVIERSTFTLTQGSEGIMSLAGSVIIRNTTVYSGHNAIVDHQGKMWVYDSHTEDNFVGLKIYPYCTANWGPDAWLPWTPAWFLNGPKLPNLLPVYCAVGRDAVLINNDVSWSSWIGIHVSESNATVQNNKISVVAGDAIDVTDMNSNVIIKDNEIDNNWYGITSSWMPDAPGPNGFFSQVQIINNNISKCRFYASYIGKNANPVISWIYNSPGHITESNLFFQLPITVVEGGVLTIRNAAMELYTTPVKPAGIIVQDKGHLELENLDSVYLGKSGRASYIRVQTGGTAHIFNSTLQELGYQWGVGGETAGFYNAGDLLFENSTVANTQYGIVFDGGVSTLRNIIFKNCTDGIRVLSGNISIYNSSISSTTGLDIKADDAQIKLYDTQFDRSNYQISSGQLDVFWSCAVESMWNNGATIANASFNVSEPSGTQVMAGNTGTDGLSGKFYLREFTDTGTGVNKTTPHKVSGSFIGMKNSTMADIISSTTIPLYIPDNGLPWLKIISPGLVVFQKNNTLFVNGSAGDNESGIDRVQWSLDQDLWTDVDGLASWNFTMELSFGSYRLYVRALDRAGNIVNKTMSVTIDSSPPSIHILDPVNGFTTKLRTVLVYGRTEIGCNVTIKDQSLLSTDGSFRLSVPIDEGANLLVATVTDATGNTNSSTVLVFRDTTPPKIIITSPPDNYITNKISEQNLLVVGLTEPGAKLISGGRDITVNDDGTFSFTFGLKEGINEISLVVEDTLGNQNSTVRHVIYDRAIPSLNITSPKDGLYTKYDNVTIIGSTEGSANISAKSINFTATTKADQEGRFTIVIGLSEGANLIQVTAKDRAGNIKTASVNVFRDSIAPILILTGATDGMETDLAYLIIEGQTDIGARVKFNGNILNVGVSGRFGTTLDLFQANNTFVFEAMDKAGNSKVVTLHIKRKVTAEPKPTGANAALEYLPWLLLIVLIVVLVQWAAITKVTKDKATQKHAQSMQPVSEDTPEEDTGQQVEDTPRRIQPKRPRQGAQVVVEHDAPEFEIEYGEGSRQAPGGGRR
jgi:hypothetical protein